MGVAGRAQGSASSRTSRRKEGPPRGVRLRVAGGCPVWLLGIKPSSLSETDRDRGHCCSRSHRAAAGYSHVGPSPDLRTAPLKAGLLIGKEWDPENWDGGCGQSPTKLEATNPFVPSASLLGEPPSHPT